MKTKLQVIHTLTETIKFVFTNIPTIFRIGWVGITLSLLILAGLGYAIYDSVDWSKFSAAEDGASDAETLGMIGDFFKIYGAIVGWFLLSYIVLTPFMVMLKQMAAGTAAAPAGIGYFRFGAREWRFIGSHIVLFLLSLAVYILLALIVGGLFAAVMIGGSAIDLWGNVFADQSASGAGVTPSGGQIALIILFYLIGVVLFIWFWLRASLFTTAAAIENSVAPMSAFGLTGGNVWRLLATFVLYSLFLMAVEMVLQFVLIFVFLGSSFSMVGAMQDDTIPWGLFAVLGVTGGAFMLVYMMLRMALDTTLTAKMYQSLTRSYDGDTDLVGGLSDQPRPLS
ncbi:hypothetical protein [Aquisalinus flavus]|uniref:Uncharacterized protein n=1 Tax=Aquisalinus flavus TaxID=1526572 RepID=A0A8J2Y6T1_9PROT|nr:hypothetical protein [Aquisalinus flavus]MBD0426528.1 hypothetical protein [Aquisalinus flavus]UNE47921.1 hypothetical protein FF099_07610 [Aquisalinus flavus]GGD07249.1 hypothetical protein GCM10011342_15060 [Aquisalinus flavus]